MAAVCGLPYLLGGPVWDDATLITGQLTAVPLGDLGSLWTGPIRPDGPGSTYFRPLALSIMAVLGRLGIPAIHVAAVVLHAVSAGLLVRLLARIGARGTGPLLGGVVFAIHPLVSEVLGWASAMPDALAVTLGLWAALVGGGAGLGVLVLAGALCKETAVLVPLAFGVAGGLRPGWWRPWGVAVGVWMVIRLGVGVASPTLVADKLALVPLALGWSMGGVVWPLPLSAVRDLLAPPLVLPWVGLVLTVAMAARCGRDRRAWAGLGLLVVAPALAMPTVLDGYLVGERYLYPGLVGLALWLGVNVSRSVPRWVGWGAAVLMLAVHVDRARDWRDDLSLFSSATQAQPTSSYAWHFLGVAQGTAGRWDDASLSFERAMLTGHPHPQDRLLRLTALVKAGSPVAALTFAEEGPQEGLTAEYIAWWAKAAWQAGDTARAAGLVSGLRNGAGFDGPPWVAGLDAQIQRAPTAP